MNYLEYFHSTKKRLEEQTGLALKQDIDFAYTASNFASKFKGIFKSKEAASKAKQSIAMLRTLNASNANFAFLLCEQISALDIDLSEASIKKGITIEDVLHELNTQLANEGVGESEFIKLETSYHILSKRGAHIYFISDDALLNQKRSVKLNVKSEVIQVDWLARRSGQAQADFALFMPPKNVLGLDDEEYQNCYYRKPLGDDFSKIVKPSPLLAEALANVLEVDFRMRATAIGGNEQSSLFEETPVLSSVQLEQSQLLKELYSGVVALDIPNQPLLKLGQILERESALFGQLSKRLGGDIPLIEHVKALKAGERLDGTSNNCMAHYLNAYLLDGAADLETDQAKKDFNKFVETLFVLLQMSSSNMRHFEKTIESYHIAQVYNNKENAAKRKAFSEYLGMKESIAGSSYKQGNASFVNADLAMFNKFIEKFLTHGAPIPFFDTAADKFAVFDGVGISYYGTVGFKLMVEKCQGLKIGGKDGISLTDIPSAEPIYDPSRSELFFVADRNEEARLVSEKAHKIYINTYKPSRARARFFNPNPSLNLKIDSLESFTKALETNAPYTYHLLYNLTGQDAKGIAVVCSALARHLENPSTTQQAIVFQDLGGTGKSTLAEAVSSMFGSNGVNITSDSVGSKFLRKSFDGQLFTHCEDLSAAVLTSDEFTSFLKTYVGNPTLRLEEKNAKQISIKNNNLMFITTNYTGAFATENGNVNRRLTIINAATKSKPLTDVEHWNAIDFDEARRNFFFEFTTAFVDVLSYALKFLLQKEYKERYLSAIFESLTEDSKSRITPDSIAESIAATLFARADATTEVDGESKNTVELNELKLSLAIQTLSPLDGSFKSNAFIELLDTLRTQRNCMISAHSLKYAFGRLGSQIFAILENYSAESRVLKYTSCMDIDAKDHRVARRSTYKALVLWNKMRGETLPNAIPSKLELDELEVGYNAKKPKMESRSEKVSNETSQEERPEL